MMQWQSWNSWMNIEMKMFVNVREEWEAGWFLYVEMGVASQPHPFDRCKHLEPVHGAFLHESMPNRSSLEDSAMEDSCQGECAVFHKLQEKKLM